MSRRDVMVAAYLLDWVVGDPEWFPHPVRLIGKSIDAGERVLRRPGQSAAVELAAGGALTVGLVVATYVGTAKIVAWAGRRAGWFGVATETALAWTCLASRSLHDEASAVVDALEEDDVELARRRLARIVGRDTGELVEQEISRAVIETVAESASDGVMAPLFYMAIGGVPLAMAYKTVNTLDSMIGHADERYFYFGKVAARLDDVANFLPSRLTALGIAGASTSLGDRRSGTAMSTWMRDGMKHKSPNAGQPESAMAGALGVRLGGENFYAGERMMTPLMGEEFPAAGRKSARQAIRIAAAVSGIGLVATLLLRRKA
jgi:adenosylcobinamide-phosphate synthase